MFAVASVDMDQWVAYAIGIATAAYAAIVWLLVHRVLAWRNKIEARHDINRRKWEMAERGIYDLQPREEHEAERRKRGVSE